MEQKHSGPRLLDSDPTPMNFIVSPMAFDTVRCMISFPASLANRIENANVHPLIPESNILGSPVDFLEEKFPELKESSSPSRPLGHYFDFRYPLSNFEFLERLGPIFRDGD